MLGLPVSSERPRLYHNQGDGTFREVSREMDLADVLLAMGSNFGDIDEDGYPDVYVGTGEPNLATLVPNRMYRNDRGRRFQDVTTSGGFGHLQKGHGIAFADLDNDGDLDVLAVMGGAYPADTAHDALFRNPGHGHHVVTLLLQGVRSNRSAIGARVRVRIAEAGGERDVRVTVGTGGSFGSSSLRQTVGLGDATALREIEVRWPASGIVQRFTDVAMDRAYRIREDAAALEPVELPPGRL